MNKNKTLQIILIWISLIIVAVLGSIFVNLGMDWFMNLNKPNEWIPNILIPIVWTVIYLTFAIVLSIWANKEKLPKNIIILLIINGILNILWCLIFFTLNQLFLGNIAIILNLIFGFKLLFDINRENSLYAWILAIYPTWLSIATTLNLAVWILN